MPNHLQQICAMIALVTMYGRCMPLKWDKTKKCLYAYQTSGDSNSGVKILRVKQRMKAFFWMHMSGVLIFAGQLGLVSLHQSESLSSQILLCMTLTILVVHNVELRATQQHPEEICSYVNGLFHFLDQMKLHHPDKRRGFVEKMNIFFTLTLIPTAFVVPIGYVFGLHWFHPHGKPSLMGFWLLGEGETACRLPIKLAIFASNLWVWTSGLYASIFSFGILHSLCTICLRDCIHVFWNMEVNPRCNSIVKSLETYRQIQVLGNLQTDILAGTMMTVFLVGPTICTTLSLVVMLRLPWTSGNIVPVLLNAYIAFICTMAVIFSVGGQAGLWSDSRQMFVKLDRLNAARKDGKGRLERMLHERFWKSCRNLMKVKFGVNNFVEKVTPLSCVIRHFSG